MDYGIAAKQLINLYILSHHTDVSTVNTTILMYLLFTLLHVSTLLFCSAGGSEAAPHSPSEDHPALCEVEQRGRHGETLLRKGAEVVLSSRQKGGREGAELS